MVSLAFATLAWSVSVQGLTVHCTRPKTGAGGIPKPVGTPSLGGRACSSSHEWGPCVLRCGGQMSSLPGSTFCVLMVSSWVRGEGAWALKRRLGFTLLDSVSHRHLGLLILALLGLIILLGVILFLLCRRLLPGKFTWDSQDRHSRHHLSKLGKSSDR